jgi:Rrf2 family protein
LLSSTADYALRAILFLAQRHGEAAVPADEVARATGAPRNYMAKTLNALARAGFLTSARGPLGGFCLARSPGALSIAQVIDCFDEPRPLRQCLLGTRACDPLRPCTAHHRWSAITGARRAAFDGTTVADLLAG